VRVVILAGGRGTRLLPYSLVLPKPLIPIVDMPILEIELRQLRHFGFSQVTIAVGHLANLIIAMFGDGRKLGLEIDYAIEDRPRGTVGPLAQMPDLRRDNQPFLLMNGDTLTDLDLRAFAEQHSRGTALVSVATFAKSLSTDLGVVEMNEDKTLVTFTEKPRITFSVSMGIYAISPGVLDLIPEETPFGFDDLMRICLEKRVEVRCHPHNGLWLDIGRPDDCRAAIEIFEKQRHAFCPWE
jgi:NDP-sugar pyrophosphorylase family protein